MRRSQVVEKTVLREDQKNRLEAMAAEELSMAGMIHPPFFNNEMEGLGVLQEEWYEANKDISNIRKAYDSLQHYLCEGQTKAAVDCAKQMRGYAMHACMELIQVAAMCQKFEESEVLW